ncbi:MAG TPA: isoprenylcysteine carboxylmethyltransferase family protein [Bacteroidota bacterium]|nr:isoprenylcysteine carboxylmethyltransferase family protein [Bacteroidota bacterium]
MGLLNLLLIMGLSLFLAAGTLKYWEGWSYLLIFVLACVIITVYFLMKDPDLIRLRLKAGPMAEKRPVQKIIQLFTSLIFIAFFILAGLDHRFGWSNVPHPVVIAADIATALAFTFIFSVFRENSYTSGIIEIASRQHVISSGPYSIVRHPMYSGALALLVATPVALGSWWSLLLAVPMLILIILRVVDEEQLLRRNLSEYEEYCRQVPYRLLPRIW